jgi:hypothetical protein
MNFHEHSKAIAEDYLGTVAYVDDLIFSNKLESKAINLGKVELREMAALENATIVESAPEKPERQLQPNIDPLKFVNGFLNKGIHCALIEVTNDGDPLEPIKQILKKTDVAILDWQMHGDSGSKAKQLLLSLMPNTANADLRLIIIYTEEKSFASILPEIILPELIKIGITNGVLDASNCKYLHGHTKIVVLKKENGEKKGLSVSDEELPGRIIDEFTEITKGLVSNTALKAVSIIRRNTHNLLGNFNKNLDAAYLAHRAMLLTPEDSELLLKNTIIDSVDSLLTYSQINSVNNIDQIEKWIDDNDFPSDIPQINIGKANSKLVIKVNKENMKKWLKVGWKKLIQDQPNNQLVDSQYESFERGNGQLFSTAIKSFIPNGGSASEDFAILTHHKSNFITPSYIPYLTLGVVVQCSEDYFLCIQQRCESVRIEKNETRNFLFLPLTQKGSFPIVFKNEGGEYIIKKVNLSKCHNLFVKQFEQTDHGIVKAAIEEGAFYFISSDGSKFRWILDLKESHAQRIANKYAAELSRVGLDESEWLRRN